jgi:thiamine-phosphate pyrophosphorylase
MPVERARLAGLYAITPERSDTDTLVREVAACLEGGAALLQYRAKHVAPGTALLQARRLSDLCRTHGVPFIVNDSIALALACDADGVHVGREDGSVREARIALPRGIVGVSCYGDPARASEAARDGADYVAIGSVFASTTKPQAIRAPLALIGEARAASGLPVAAIGGITPSNAAEAIAAGADMLAVIAAIFESRDPRAAARSFTTLFPNGPTGEPHARTQPRAV